MKLRPLRRAEVRDIDRIAIEQYGIAGIVLMENAGSHAARWITSSLPAGDVCILCGKGNNGGDGYVIARHIETAANDQSGRDWKVRVVSLVDCDELSGDAAVNHAIARRAGIPISTAIDRRSIETLVGTPHVLVDCLLGTGATGAPRGLYSDAVRLANRLPAKKIAIDIPTGLDCDTGIAADPTLIADVTLTFVADKIGFTESSATKYLGQVVPIAIGVPRQLLMRYQTSR
jgi:NAD(P)H-hydrate epimerase